jgi:hypothetical protein
MQRPAEHRQRDGGAEDGVDDEEVHQHPRDLPQHGAEGEELQHRADQDQQEVQRALGEGVDVLGDALVGVVDGGVGVQLVVVALREVAVEEAAGQPAPPEDAELVAHEVVEGVHRHGEEQQAEAVADGGPEALFLARRQGRGEFAGLLVEEHGEARLAEQQQHQQRQQAPGLDFSSWRQ